MRFILFVLILGILGCFTTTPRAEDIPPEKAAWMVRTMVPMTIGKIRTMKEYSKWCIYEQGKVQPDDAPCKLFEAGKGTSADIVEVAQLIKTTLANLKAEPQTSIIKEHITVLEAALQEIMDSLQPIP